MAIKNLAPKGEERFLLNELLEEDYLKMLRSKELSRKLEYSAFKEFIKELTYV
jgi:hypothetical protein